MKKLIVMAVAALSFVSAKADEGMWTLYNLPQAVYKQMVAEGYSLPYESLYYGGDAVKNSVVNFSGFCSGVVVSPNGLVFTNHHCGFEAIRSHSTVEHDYMLNGFYAKTYEEELPNKDMFVSFMIEQKDITPRLEAMNFDAMDVNDQYKAIEKLQQELTDSVKKINKTYHIEIDPFFEGNKYYATTYQMFPDLRLVFTIPKSMGKFGGDTDNWMWPRQTCDFAVFRIYADPETNEPAAYNEKNVPYKPKHWAPVSLQGYQEDDFAMTLGYPGSTNRYLSSYGIKERRDAQNAPRAQVRGVKQAVMRKHMNANQAVRIMYEGKYATSSNYWKNSIGMNKCIDSIGIIQQKQEFEARIKEWQKTNNSVAIVDFDKLEELYSKRLESMTASMFWSETFYKTNELCTRAMSYKYLPLQGDKSNSKKQYIEFKDNTAEWDINLDKDVLGALLQNYRENVDAKYLPSFYRTIDKKFKGNCYAYVDYLYEKSILLKKGEKLYVNSKAFKKDPGVVFGKEFMKIYQENVSQAKASMLEIEKIEKDLCAAKVRMEQDKPHYSDANFTMRLSYGQVKNFSLNGKDLGYYTTMESLVDKINKSNDVPDYKTESAMKMLLSSGNYSHYTDPKTGKMQLCFITNNDITGGNSGSPMFNGKGELIGLAFDGNWDSLSSGINFDSNLARCIGVDIRFVLYMMDCWGNADRLLQEINAK